MYSKSVKLGAVPNRCQTVFEQKIKFTEDELHQHCSHALICRPEICLEVNAHKHTS